MPTPPPSPVNNGLETPVVLFLFNRPDSTARVFEVIRQIRPKHLMLVADGPRSSHGEDDQLCRSARAMVHNVDWECNLVHDYADQNMGLGHRVSSGLEHAFRRYEAAIILEDDTLPDLSFFAFCRNLLERYRDDERIMMISGTNNLVKWQPAVQDYHFSAYGSIWGWATWRRAWRHYDYALKSLEDGEVRKRVADMLGDPEQFAYREKVCREVKLGRTDTWDYQWTWARLAAGGLAAVSAVNLVSNIGFGEQATHTRSFNLAAANLQRTKAPENLRPPDKTEADREYDHRYFNLMRQRIDADDLYRHGVEFIKNGNNVRGFAVMQALLKQRPNDIPVLLNMAQALRNLGQLERSQTLVNRLLSIDPDHREGNRFLSQLRRHQA